MVFVLQFFFGFHLQSFYLWVWPRNPPPPPLHPAFGLLYEGAIGQLYRRHLIFYPLCVHDVYMTVY
jgi:hypothetical protein